MMDRILQLFIGIILFGGLLVSADITLNPEPDISVVLKDVSKGVSVVASRGKNVYNLGIIGIQFAGKNYTSWNTDRIAILDFKEAELKISLSISKERWQLNFRWTAASGKRLVDCIQLSPNQWFGGPEQKHQHWPVQKLKLNEYSYVTKEEENSAVTEPYWINSNGTIIYVDKEVPLFIDQNNIMNDHLCLIAQVKAPYSTKRKTGNLIYDVVFTKNAKVGHQYAVGRYLGKPIGYPDFRMLQHPIWSTWARYLRPINESIVMKYANEIISNGFNNSQFEIDDLWEICYGSLTVDVRTFPDFPKMVQNLKDLGFRVTMWIHPFINKGCDPWYTEALNKGYLVKDETGNVSTNWWNNNGTIGSYVDFTNPAATSWWIKRVMDLKNLLKVDSFKFDAGESSWSPQVPTQTGEDNLHPSHITADYVRAVADFGPMIEVRTGQRTQELPVFVRMVDKDTLWDFENGLPTVVTTLLQMNMNGYPLVLPDMIGGNGYNEKPSKELFIRWAQANTFMPSMQYSFVPWDYDNQTIAICRKYTDIHAMYAQVISDAMEKCVEDGSPVNPPIWWLDPTDLEALKIWDEYLLGNSILVAPILDPNTTKRNIYLPRGNWTYAEDSGKIYTGPVWLKDFSSPLDTLPYFKLIAHSSATKCGGITILALIMGAIGYIIG